MTPGHRLRLAYLLLWLTPALWSANYVAARAAAGTIGPHQLALARWSLALMLMLPFAWPELRERWPRWRGEWPRLLVLGALGMWICGAFVYLGAETTLTINIGLIYAIAPVLIAIGSVGLLGEQVGTRQIYGAALSLAGVLVVLFKGSPAAVANFALTRGDLWISIAALSWTCFSLLLRRWQSALGPFARTVAITAAGVLVLVPFTFFETLSLGAPAPSWKLGALVLVVAVLPGVCAYQAYAFVQREFGAARTAIVMYLAPLYGGLIAWAVLGETPGWHHAFGAALILPGIRLATTRR